MTKYIPIIVVFILCFYPGLVTAQTELPPDFSNWNLINYSRIELRISDCNSVYLGIEENYQNPNEFSEYGRVYKSHIPLAISNCDSFDKKSVIATATSLYVKQEEQTLLRESTKKSDPILYVKWNSDKDHSTRIWIMPPEGPDHEGRWLVFENLTVEEEFLTENIGNSKPENVFAGKKYQVGTVYHLMRVSRHDIIRMIYKEEE